MAGRAARLTQLNARVGEDLIRYATRLTGDRALAEDIAQEALLRAWRDATILTCSLESGRRWLFTVTRRLVIDQARSARHRHEVPYAEPPARPLDPTEGRLAERDALARALGALPERQRHAIVAVYLAEATVAEAARAAGVPPGTLKSRLHYGLAALRDLLRAADAGR